MRTFFVCLAAAGAAFTTWASDIPQVSTTSNTRLAGDKRDSPTATVTLGPSSLYSLAVVSVLLPAYLLSYNADSR